MLLCAGLGTRLCPLTNERPKCLLEIQGRPLLEHWVRMLSEAGVGPILVNVHYMADQVVDFLARSGLDSLVETVYEEKLLGTAGAVLRNRAFFRNEPFVLVHGDNLSRFDVGAFLERHRTRPPACEITMMTFRSPTPQSCGIVEVDDRGVVIDMREKVPRPPSDLANAAVYVVEPTIHDFLASLGREVIDFSTEVISRFLGRIYTFHNDVYHRDIGTPESYEAALREFPIASAGLPRRPGR